jgi:hypothetical protein
MKNHIISTVVVAILVYFTSGFACSFSTANISDLKFSANEEGDPPATTFNTGENIFAIATVSNAMGKMKLNWKVSYENVAGKSKGQEIGNKTMDFEGSNTLWQQFSTGLPGDYKVEATLMDENGKTLESKQGTVTVTGARILPRIVEKDDDEE